MKYSRIKIDCARGRLLFVALAIPGGRPSIEMDGFHFVESKLDRRQMDVKAERARMYKPEDLLALDELEARIWGSTRKPYTVNGKIGVMDSNSEDFTIHSYSRILTPEGYIFETENLDYIASNRSLSTDSPVTSTPPQSKASTFEISGRGLLIDIETNVYEVLNDVQAVQKRNGKNTLYIRSKKSKFSPAADLAEFFINVHLDSDSLKMDGDKLGIDFYRSSEDEAANPKTITLSSLNAKKKIRAQVANLKISSDGLVVSMKIDGEVKLTEAIGGAIGETDDGLKMQAEKLSSDTFKGKQRIVLKENVNIETNGRVATCEEATIYPESGKIILSKTASLVSSDQTLTGELIEFSTKNSEIVVKKASGSVDKNELRRKE